MGWESSDVSDLTLGPSFKVKQWFTGCGELSFRWIQICIGSPIRRSSLDIAILCFTVCTPRMSQGFRTSNFITLQ